MIASTIVGCLSVLAAGVSAAPHVARKTTSDVTLYAYGTGLSGLPIYSDASGYAYLASSSTNQSLSGVAWTIDSTGSTAWNGSLNGTTASGAFYILPTGKTLARTGFSLNSTLASTAELITLGFVTYGSDVMFVNGSTYQAQFWASNTTTAGVWDLVWNTDGSDMEGAVPVTLKTKAPLVVDPDA